MAKLVDDQIDGDESIWMVEFHEPLPASPATTSIAVSSDLLLYIFSFVPCEPRTLLALCHVSRAWRERARRVRQWHTCYEQRFGILPPIKQGSSTSPKAPAGASPAPSPALLVDAFLGQHQKLWEGKQREAFKHYQRLLAVAGKASIGLLFVLSNAVGLWLAAVTAEQDSQDDGNDALKWGFTMAVCVAAVGCAARCAILMISPLTRSKCYFGAQEELLISGLVAISAVILVALGVPMYALSQQIASSHSLLQLDHASLQVEPIAMGSNHGTLTIDASARSSLHRKRNGIAVAGGTLIYIGVVLTVLHRGVGADLWRVVFGVCFLVLNPLHGIVWGYVCGFRARGEDSACLINESSSRQLIVLSVVVGVIGILIAVFLHRRPHVKRLS